MPTKSSKTINTHQFSFGNSSSLMLDETITIQPDNTLNVSKYNFHFRNMNKNEQLDKVLLSKSDKIAYDNFLSVSKGSCIA